MRIGFLGAGLIATFHSKMLRAATGIERAGVYDPDMARAAAFAKASGHKVCADAREVLDTCDAVYICTWTSEHQALAEAAATRRLAIFLEKPLAPTLAGAEAVAAVVSGVGVTNQVGLILRRSPAFVLAKALVDDPAAGQLMNIVLRDDQFIPIQGEYASTWRGDVTKAGAGTLLEHSIHDIDMLHFLAGPISTVTAQTSSFHGIHGIEDVASSLVRFDSGATATLSSVWHDNLARPSLRRVEIFGARRWRAVDGDDWFGPVQWTDANGATGHVAGAELAARAETLLDGPANPDVAFVEAALADVAAWPDVTTALQAHRAIDAMYRSAALGGHPVDLHTRPGPQVVVLTPTQTHDLRKRVLRNGTPSTELRWAHDDAPGTLHLGVMLDGDVVATSTWQTEPWRGQPSAMAVRLRGMAVEPGLQSKGVGSLLVKAGLERAWASGAQVVWASARDRALEFYERLGFRVDGDGFVDETTALPHHLIWTRRPR